MDGSFRIIRLLRLVALASAPTEAHACHPAFQPVHVGSGPAAWAAAMLMTPPLPLLASPSIGELM